MATKPVSFAPAAAARDRKPALDLGKPRWLLRERDRLGRWSETWIYCPRCLARKVEDGSRTRYAGGFVHLLRAPVTRRDGSVVTLPDGRPWRRPRAIIPCDCALGLELRRRLAKQLRVATDRLPLATSFAEDELALPVAAVAARSKGDSDTEIVGPFGEADVTQTSGRAEAEEELPF